jgi:hypothetical protein
VAIAVHGTPTHGDRSADTGAALSFSHTITAGADLCLYVGVALDTIQDEQPVTCAWNGTGLDPIAEIVGSDTAQHLLLFRLINPTPATGSVVINSGNGLLGVNNIICQATAVTFSGVPPSSPNDTPVTANDNTGTDPDLTVTSAADDLVLDLVAVNQNVTFTADGGQTIVPGSNRNHQGAGGGSMAMSTRAGAAPTVNMGWTLDVAGGRLVHIAVNITVAGAGAQTLDGVAPSVTVSAGTATVTPGAVSVAGSAPSVTVSAGTATITPGVGLVAGAAPSVTVSAGTATLAPGAGTIPGAAPTVTVSVGTATLAVAQTLAGVAPTVTVSAPTASVSQTLIGTLVVADVGLTIGTVTGETLAQARVSEESLT